MRRPDVRGFLQALMLSLLALSAAPAHAAIDEDDLLPVDQAFVLTARAVAPGRIAVDWRLADGYYLYRHRLSAEPANAGGRASPLALPRGEKHTDEFFGEVETFRGGVTGTLDGVSASGPSLALRIKYQGCADAGICYPPQTRTLTVALPTNDAAPGSGDAGFGALGQLLRGNAPVPVAGKVDALPLPPEQAFRFEAIVGDGNTLLLRFTPAPGYYLYRDRSAFRLEGARDIAIGRARWPAGVSHHDEHFGEMVVYFDQVEATLPLGRTAPDATKATLVATFQGCQTDGICYPPMTRRVALSIPAGRVAATPAVGDEAAPVAPNSPDAAPGMETPRAVQAPADANGIAPVRTPPRAQDQRARDATTAAADATASQAEDSRLAALLSGSHRWLALLGFFVAGLGLAFTPCVYPMIPILSGLIASDTTARGGARIGAARAFWLSLVYVLASALVFTAVGVVAGLLGANLQIAFQKPWVIAAFATVFVALALSMFGLYELQLPASLRARLGAMSDRQRGGSWWGVAAMGALSALIVGPCVAPPLAGAVLYIGQTRDPVLGGAALFALAMGMGAPLLAFGMAAGKGMPTSGPWMVAAQRAFGFVFVGLAVWMLSRILPGPATLALYGLVLLAAAAWAFSLARADAGDGVRWGTRFAGLVLAVAGAAQLFGALAGGHDPLQPLAGLRASGQAAPALAFRTIKSGADLDRELAAARAAGRPVMLDFYADWCVACKEMEKYTFTDGSVQSALGAFVLLKADVTANDAQDQALMQRLGIIGPPATLFYGEGGERRALRLFGFERAADFVQRIERAR